MKYSKILSLLLSSLLVLSLCTGCWQTPPEGTTIPSQPTQTQPSTSPTQPTQPGTHPTEPATQPTTPPTEPPTVPTEPPTEPPTVPTEPPIVKESTATIGATGDILMHELVIASGYDKTTGLFNYDNIFHLFSQYTSSVDYAVANLEVTLIQKDETSGFHGYHGYPSFNSPDEVAVALKTAGFDMLLTANNHSYDTKHAGFIRTQEVIRDLGLAHIGTRLSEDVKPYKVVDVNGIRIGMINYTYNTKQTEEGIVRLNGHTLTAADSKLVNSFNYYQRDLFYETLASQIEDMKADGAEAIVLYIHWGTEYVTEPDWWQKKMAQPLCDLGIDVIVGNHAHVIQPVELLTSTTDENHKTLCLYSTGNAVSNIYKSEKHPVTTEDGMLFTFTFAKYSDGTVVVESADVLPTWVYRYDEQDVRKFKILPLDDTVEDWKTALGISNSVLKKCQDSYQRTVDTVGPGLEIANTWFAQHQAEVEAALGVQ